LRISFEWVHTAGRSRLFGQSIVHAEDIVKSKNIVLAEIIIETDTNPTFTHIGKLKNIYEEGKKGQYMYAEGSADGGKKKRKLCICMVASLLIVYSRLQFLRLQDIGRSKNRV